MRRKLAPLLVGPALLAAAAASGAATQEKPPCAQAHSTTLYRNEGVRVFEWEPNWYSIRTTACLLGTGKRTLLAVSRDDHWYDFRKFKVAGPWIAYTYDEGWKGLSYPDTYLCATNVRTGAGQCSGRAEQFHGFGVTRAGSIAWLEESWTDGSCCYVYEQHPGGAPYGAAVLLDSGDDIDTASFAVGGQHIYWTKAGAAKSATMP